MEPPDGVVTHLVRRNAIRRTIVGERGEPVGEPAVMADRPEERSPDGMLHRSAPVHRVDDAGEFQRRAEGAHQVRPRLRLHAVGRRVDRHQHRTKGLRFGRRRRQRPRRHLGDPLDGGDQVPLAFRRQLGLFDRRQHVGKGVDLDVDCSHILHPPRF